MKISIRRSRRAAVAVALGSVLALTATACGDDGSSTGDKGNEGTGTGKIVFWDNNGGVRTDIWKEVIADFEKANPKIDVEYVGIASTELLRPGRPGAAGQPARQVLAQRQAQRGHGRVADRRRRR
jgi:multiple sugar transport system substrate-binding protein